LLSYFVLTLTYCALFHISYFATVNFFLSKFGVFIIETHIPLLQTLVDRYKNYFQKYFLNKHKDRKFALSIRTLAIDKKTLLENK